MGRRGLSLEWRMREIFEIESKVLSSHIGGATKVFLCNSLSCISLCCFLYVIIFNNKVKFLK